ncbi:MAG: response regulator [Desulfatibacillaceae bacterium]
MASQTPEPEQWAVVLIDDEADIREVTSITLEDAGYSVRTAIDGAKGIAACEAAPPHIVITDIRMPGSLDGLAVLEQVKQRWPDTEVIVITAYGDVDIAIRALQLDASDFVTKPINAAALHTALDRARDRYLSRKNLRDHARLLEEENARTSEELRRIMAWRRGLIENSMDGIMGLSPDGVVAHWNPAMEEIAGYRRDEVVGRRRFDDFIDARDRDRLMDALASDKYGGKGRLYVHEAGLAARDGSRVPVRVSASTVNTGDDRPGTVWFFRDLRTLRRLEREMEDQARMLHQDKMMSLGRLAASVVHEINNPLSGILNYLRLMQRTMERGDPGPDKIARFREYLDLVVGETARCSNIVSNLLTFSRRTADSTGPVDVDDLLERSALLSRHKCELSDVDLAVHCQPDTPPVAGDFNQLQQCVLNLVMNAVDAMPDGGKLTLAARRNNREDRVRIEVRDTGPGIPEDILPNIFEPFFTTKEEGYGVGLGLSTVYGIVLNHGGTVRAENARDGGARFLLDLPAASTEDREG